MLAMNTQHVPILKNPMKLHFKGCCGQAVSLIWQLSSSRPNMTVAHPILMNDFDTTENGKEGTVRPSRRDICPLSSRDALATHSKCAMEIFFQEPCVTVAREISARLQGHDAHSPDPLRGNHSAWGDPNLGTYKQNFG